MGEEHTNQAVEQNNATNQNAGGGNAGGNGRQSAGGHGGGNDDITLAIRKATSKNTERIGKQVAADCLRYGVEPVKNEKGRVDFSATIDKFADHLRKTGAPEAAAILEQRYAGQIADLTQKLKASDEQLQQTRIITKVRERLALQNPYDLDDVQELFLKAYKVGFDEDTGDYFVTDKQGKPIYNPINAAEMTIDDVIAKFLEEKKNLRSQTKGDGLQGMASMKGMPGRTNSDEFLVAELEEALKTGDKKKVSAVEGEMRSRLSKQFGNK
jgi:hypothetical protein